MRLKGGGHFAVGSLAGNIREALPLRVRLLAKRQ